MAEIPTADRSPAKGISRRRFLHAATCATALPATRLAAGTLGDADELRLLPWLGRPRVVRVQSSHVIEQARVHETLLREMIWTTLTNLTDKQTPAEGWRTLLRSDDVVGIKFNRSAQSALGTTPSMASALIESLLNAGFRADQLVCIECPEAIENRFGTLRAKRGFSSTVTKFGSGADNLALVLDQVTALLNVPFLKTHNIAGITCCLKNLSHGLIKHPARYHANGCSPYVADVVALPQIRDKLRLCVVDGLRPMYAGGPSSAGSAVAGAGIVLASTDPVACDATGLLVLNAMRQDLGLGPVASSAAEVPHLAAAHRAGLGVALLQGIDLRTTVA